MALMGPIDSMFLLVESREHPMHIGGLQLFTPPEGAGPDWVREEMVGALRPEPSQINSRFRMRPALPINTVGSVFWREDNDIDLDHHVRRSAVPGPGRLRELFELTSRWQGSLLDRYRPLWEAHVVEGLEDGRIAVFSKVHHALVDGVSALQLMQRACSPDPDARDCLPPYAAPEAQRLEDTVPASGLLSPSSLARGSRDLIGELATMGPRALQVGWKALRDPDFATMFDAPRTILNGRIGGSRRFVAQTWEMDRFRTISKAADVSFNDVVLAVCAGGLRAYLSELGELPEKSLTAMCPVNLREDLTEVGGNNIGAIITSLATDVIDPVKRLEAIHRSAMAAKTSMRELSPLQILLMSGLNVAGLGLAPMPGYLNVSGPPFNVIISNVPGPKKQMYFNGAHLEGTYPASIPIDGMAMNITLVTYDDQVDFGITACRRSAPHVQRMIHHMEDSLAELEAAV
ncbi:diacylglycerol O-acyltransferase [Luteipulveratus halotolerans]|uniref:Diacylglycerol O-acyltransferase n=2 Tax=Luteipulveratus halotolerans TaxID=1631356 RepID=A0A0L6CNS4_9MICO|nr:diacylglycerol O-acyltransferase [Luteipulveratus halotolerans]